MLCEVTTECSYNCGKDTNDGKEPFEFTLCDGDFNLFSDM